MKWACTEVVDELQAIFEKAKSEMMPRLSLRPFLELRKLRQISQSFARDAAPYRHPKLHAVAVAEESEPPKKLINPFQHRTAEILESYPSSA